MTTPHQSSLLRVAQQVREAARQLALARSTGDDLAAAIANSISQIDLSALLSTTVSEAEKPDQPSADTDEPKIPAPAGYGDAFEHTDRHYWAMCSAGMSLPVALDEANLTKPYVYDRQYGVFYVNAGQHPAAMALLLAWQHGLNSGVDVAHQLGLRYSTEAAEHYLETTPGACFKSSVSQTAETWRIDHLTDNERRALGRLRSLA